MAGRLEGVAFPSLLPHGDEGEVGGLKGLWTASGNRIRAPFPLQHIHVTLPLGGMPAACAVKSHLGKPLDNPPFLTDCDSFWLQIVTVKVKQMGASLTWRSGNVGGDVQTRARNAPTESRCLMCCRCCVSCCGGHSTGTSVVSGWVGGGVSVCLRVSDSTQN